MWSSPGTPGGTGPSAGSRTSADIPAMGRPMGTTPSTRVAAVPVQPMEGRRHRALGGAVLIDELRAGREVAPRPAHVVVEQGLAGGEDEPEGGRGQPAVLGGAGERPEHRRDDGEQCGDRMLAQARENGRGIRRLAVRQQHHRAPTERGAKISRTEASKDARASWSTTSLGPSPNVRYQELEIAHDAPCAMGTPLGVPVEPEVKAT